MEEKRRKICRRTPYKIHITNHKQNQPKTPNQRRNKYQNSRWHSQWSWKQIQSEALDGKNGKHQDWAKTRLHEWANTKTMQRYNKSESVNAHNKDNYKKANEGCTTCRFCSKMPETQEHVLQHCPRVENRTINIEYQEIFKDDSSRLKEIATEISRIEEVIKNMSPK